MNIVFCSEGEQIFLKSLNDPKSTCFPISNWEFYKTLGNAAISTMRSGLSIQSRKMASNMSEYMGETCPPRWSFLEVM